MIISLGKIIIVFPVPIILALLLNEMKNLKIKKITQTVLYFPYFVSWTVIGTVIISLFSPTFGVLGSLYKRIWGENASLLINSRHFVPLLIVSDIWKNAGWGTIIYLAALTQVEVSLYESSIVDGANRWQQMWYITLPSIKSVIVLTLILRVGWIMHAGFEQIMVLQNPVVMDVSDVFETYVYRIGLGKGKYSFTAAVDFFNSVVALVLVVLADRFAKLMNEEGLL